MSSRESRRAALAEDGYTAVDGGPPAPITLPDDGPLDMEEHVLAHYASYTAGPATDWPFLVMENPPRYLHSNIRRAISGIRRTSAQMAMGALICASLDNLNEMPAKVAFAKLIKAIDAHEFVNDFQSDFVYRNCRFTFGIRDREPKGIPLRPRVKPYIKERLCAIADEIGTGMHSTLAQVALMMTLYRVKGMNHVDDMQYTAKFFEESLCEHTRMVAGMLHGGMVDGLDEPTKRMCQRERKNLTLVQP